MKLSNQRLDTKDFLSCQLCGAEFDNICQIDLWREHDEQDQPTSEYLIVGRYCGCQETKIDPHDLLYMKMVWSRGGPGRFTLLCGDCPYRNTFKCTHPHLVENGGEGLLVIFRQLFGGPICMAEGASYPGGDLTPAVACEGHPTRIPKEGGA